MSKRALVLGLAAAVGLSASACDSDDNEFIISNRSDFVLEEVHLAEVNDPTWGPNLLPDVLFPGEDLVIFDIACGSYDVLIVDEFGTSCELIDNDLCFNDTDRWTITNTTLAICAFPKRSSETPAQPDAGAEQTL